MVAVGIEGREYPAIDETRMFGPPSVYCFLRESDTVLFQRSGQCQVHVFLM